MGGDLVDDAVENKTDIIEVPEPEMAGRDKELTTWAAEHSPEVGATTKHMAMSPAAETHGAEVGPVGLRYNTSVVAETTEILKEGENGSGGGVDPSELVDPKVVDGTKAKNGNITRRARGKRNESG